MSVHMSRRFFAVQSYAQQHHFHEDFLIANFRKSELNKKLNMSIRWKSAIMQEDIPADKESEEPSKVGKTMS